MESTGVHAALARSALVKRDQSFPPVRHPREVLVFHFSVLCFLCLVRFWTFTWWFLLPGCHLTRVEVTYGQTGWREELD